MEIKLNNELIYDVLGTAAVAAVAWNLAGGQPIPVIGDFMAVVAAVAAGMAAWRHFRKT